MALGSDRSPHQTFGRSDFEPDPGDPDLLPKGEVVRGSKERNLFGGRERGGAGGGVLHPLGPGPLPNDIFSATDIEDIPWRRTRGNEWTVEAFRTIVKTFVAVFIRARPEQRIIGWQVEEVANGPRMGQRRIPPRDQHLVFRLTVRRVAGKVDSEPQVELAMPFPPEDREEPGTTRRLVLVESNLDLLLAGV